MASSARPFSIYTPELLWHGGGNEHGKPDPVYSVDFHPTEPILLTTGIDANVPPKGSIRLWKVSVEDEGQEFLVDLSDHQNVVNIARFSPCGRIIASASESQILIYTLPQGMKWSEITETRQLNRVFQRPSLSEVYDLDWAPDSSHIVIGALEGKAEIIRLTARDSCIVPGHTSYVQGVSWDPLHKMIATFSSDRSAKIHQLKVKENMLVKLAPRGHQTLKMMQPAVSQTVEIKASSVNENDNANTKIDKDNKQLEQAVKGINLFADSNVPSFFRRLSFSPDGSLLVVPTGLLRIDKPLPNQKATRSYCTYIYVRDNWVSPCLALPSFDEPTVAVRFCPRLFELRKLPQNEVPPLFAGDYRMVFAIVTINSVMVYDTQSPFPLCRLHGMHYAAINDAAWSPDGRLLTICSSDGYLTFVRFQPGVIGKILDDELVSEVVKQAQSCLYGIERKVAAPSAAVETQSTPMAAAVDSVPNPTTAMETEDTPSDEKNENRMDVDDATTNAKTAEQQQNQSATSNGTELKKRKRIQVTTIASNLNDFITSCTSPQTTAANNHDKMATTPDNIEAGP